MRSNDCVGRERILRGAVLAGDERAWRTWYDESFEELYAYVHWRCAGLRDLTEEVVQETWLTAVRRIRDFDPERGTFAAWLSGIAGNVLRNQLRRQRRRRALPPLAQERIAESAATALERREQAERVALALGDLPPRYEAVLRAKYLEQRTMGDIASAWQESSKAIESLLTRARQAFREAYLRLEKTHE